MSRKAAAGARDWATVLSELAEVDVALEYESPAWRVRWTDGPTVAMLTDRAHELGKHRVGEPLTTARMRFERHASPLAWALAWLGLGAPDEDVPVSVALGSVETVIEERPYPERCLPAARAASEVLMGLSWGDPHRMGELLTQAHHPILSTTPDGASMEELPGRVESLVWMRGGPPAELLGPRPVTEPVTKASGADAATAALIPGQRENNASTTDGISGEGDETRHETSVCERCGRAVPVRATGRPARYCSGACRSAAYRLRTHAQ